jgi:hypothetical protein
MSIKYSGERESSQVYSNELSSGTIISLYSCIGMKKKKKKKKTLESAVAVQCPVVASYMATAGLCVRCIFAALRSSK